MIEGTPELQVQFAHLSQADLLVASLRLIPHLLVVGEVRNEEPARALLGA